VKAIKDQDTRCGLFHGMVFHPSMNKYFISKEDFYKKIEPIQVSYLESLDLIFNPLVPTKVPIDNGFDTIINTVFDYIVNHSINLADKALTNLFTTSYMNNLTETLKLLEIDPTEALIYPGSATDFKDYLNKSDLADYIQKNFAIGLNDSLSVFKRPFLFQTYFPASIENLFHSSYNVYDAKLATTVMLTDNSTAEISFTDVQLIDFVNMSTADFMWKVFTYTQTVIEYDTFCIVLPNNYERCNSMEGIIKFLEAFNVTPELNNFKDKDFFLLLLKEMCECSTIHLNELKASILKKFTLDLNKKNLELTVKITNQSSKVQEVENSYGW